MTELSLEIINKAIWPSCDIVPGSLSPQGSPSSDTQTRRDLPDPELRARNWLSVHIFHGVVLDVRRQCEMTYADIEQNAMEDMHAEPIPGTQFRVGQVPTGFPRLASRSEQCKVVFCTLK